MNLSLSPRVQQMIDDRVRSGRYLTSEEVVAAAVELLDQQEQIAQLGSTELDALYPGVREKLAEGLADARAGRLVDGEAFFDELDRETEATNRKTA